MGAYALLIGVSKFDDPKLGKLTAPKEDVESLAAVLRDPDRGCFDQVETSIDSDVQTLREQIVSLLADRRPRDLVVFYYSGHGILAKGQRLYLATGSSSFDRPQASSLPAREIRDLLEQCRAERQVVILDCCHSGAFSEGAKGVAAAVTEDTFGTAEGQYVLTATDAQQFAYDSSGNLQEGEDASALSRFTAWLIDGIGKGEASDREEITLDDVFAYVQTRARKAAAGMTPKLLVRGKSGELVIAKNPSARAAALSGDLVGRLDSPDWRLRKAAVEELKRLSKEPRLAKLAKNAVVDRISSERDVEVREAMEDMLAGMREARPAESRTLETSRDIADSEQPKPVATPLEPPASPAKMRRPKRVKSDSASIPASAPQKSADAPPDKAEPGFAPITSPERWKGDPQPPGSDAPEPYSPRLLSHAYRAQTVSTAMPQIDRTDAAPTILSKVRWNLGGHPASFVALVLPPLLFATWQLFRLPMPSSSGPPRVFVATIIAFLIALAFNRAAAVLIAGLIGTAFALKPALFPMQGYFSDGQVVYSYWSQTSMNYWVPGVISMLVAAATAFIATTWSRLTWSFKCLRPGIAALVIAVAASGASYAYFGRPTYYDVYRPLLPQYAAFREHLKSVAASVDKVTGPVQLSRPLDPPLVLDERDVSDGGKFNEDASNTGHLFFYPLLRQPDGSFGDAERSVRSDLFWYIQYTDPSIFYTSNGTGFVSNPDKTAAALSRAIQAPYLVVVKPLGANESTAGSRYRVFLYDLRRDEVLFAADIAGDSNSGQSPSDIREPVNAVLEKAVGAKILRPAPGNS